MFQKDKVVVKICKWEEKLWEREYLTLM